MEWIDIMERRPDPGQWVQIAICDYQNSVTQAVALAEADGVFREPIGGHALYSRHVVSHGPMVVTHWHPLLDNPAIA